ncbi:MAG: methyltransferase domain-containing protein [Gammaproteobacteria bacterium]
MNSETLEIPLALDQDSQRRSVQRYYGEVLSSSADLRTSACCPPETLPAYLRDILAEVHPQVHDRFYGCGSPIPPTLEGATVLDLGCGSGRDCYLLSKLVGSGGRVIGVDMTSEQLEVAQRYRQYHAAKFGYPSSNVEFILGDIADLAAAGIADDSVDVVVSNCVINLAPNKGAVLHEVFRVLKPGGELYFSDVFADRRIPVPLAYDPVLLGECLAGALYIEDFRRLLTLAGCADGRVCNRGPITLDGDEVEHKIGMVRFESITYRAFKLLLEDRCEDYGQAAVYLGTLAYHPHRFALDDHHLFERGRPMLICGNTADMLGRTRYAPHFEVRGEKRVHYGLFDCAPNAAPGLVPTSGSCC